MFVNFLLFEEVFPTFTNNTTHRITKGTFLFTFAITVIEYISCREFTKLSFAFFVSFDNFNNIFVAIPQCVYVTQYFLLLFGFWKPNSLSTIKCVFFCIWAICINIV